MVDSIGNDGANEGFWRFQIRDKYGQWIKMGGTVSFSTNHPNFGPISGNGTFEGGARPGVAFIKVSDDHPKLGGRVVEVPSEDFESIKAIIPTDAPGLAEAKRLDALDGIIVNAPTSSPIDIETRPGSMTARDIVDNFILWDAEKYDLSKETFLDAKLRDIRTPTYEDARGNEKANPQYGLEEDVLKNGINVPIEAEIQDGRAVLLDGHTRLAIMFANNPEAEIPIKWLDAEPEVVPQVSKAKEPWKKIDTWVEDRGSFTLDKNLYGTAIDFRGLASPVSAVDPEMVSDVHKKSLVTYTGTGYKSINTYLRFKSQSKFTEADKEKIADLENKIAALDEVIQENGEVFENSRVFRGQYLDTPFRESDTNWIETMENLEVGDVISDPGYMSTSNDPVVAFKDFGPGSAYGDWLSDDVARSSSQMMKGSVMWMIDVPQGAKAFALPENVGYGQGGEREVILPRDSQLKVKGIRRVQQLDSDFEPLEGRYNYYVQADLVSQDTPGIIDVVNKTAEERGATENLALRDILSTLNIDTPGMYPRPDQNADYEKIKNQVNDIYKDKSFAGYTIKFTEAKPSKITYAEDPNESAAGFKVLGEISDGNEKIGVIIRSFGVTPTGDFIAAHDEIALYYAENKGKGFSSEFSKFSEDLYRKNGIKEIQLVAGDYDGAYVWAKAGYSWLRKPDDLAKWLLDKSKEFQYEDTVPNMSTSDREINQKRIADIANKLKLGKVTDEDYPTPFEIANLTGPDIDGMSYARWLLTESEWFGRKVL
jgi:hypothetical protein